MQGGDISGRLSPRWLFVFENVIARVPPAKGRSCRLNVRLHRWQAAVDCFVVEPHVQKTINDLYWRRDYRFDVVTFLGDQFVEPIKTLLDQHSLPVSNVWGLTEETLLKRLAYMPDVMHVVHGDPARQLAYGNRGLLVTDPERLALQ